MGVPMMTIVKCKLVVAADNELTISSGSFATADSPQIKLNVVQMTPSDPA